MTNQNCLIFSISSGRNITTKLPNCLIHHEKISCSTPKDILSNVTVNEIMRIDTIFLDNNDMITGPHMMETQRSIRITCSMKCDLSNDLFIFGDTFHQKTQIMFANITLTNSRITVGNAHVIFRSVQLFNSVITDWVAESNRFNHLVLEFSNTVFQSQLSRQPSGLVLNKVFTASVTFIESNMKNFAVHITVSHLHFS